MGVGTWLASAFTGTPVTEARRTEPGAAQVQRRGYEYGIPDSGLTEYSPGMQSQDRDRRTLMGELYDAYVVCPWAWASTNAISRRITAGGLEFAWDPPEDADRDAEQPPKPPEVVACERLFAFVNDRENIRQLLRGIFTDLLVFGDAFVEVVWIGKVPVALFSLDSPSTQPIADAHGQITGYVQVTDHGQRATFDPHEVIHISLDSPRSGVLGISPTQAALLPIQRWLFAAATLLQNYRRGDPLTLHVDLPAEMSGPDVRRWVSQHMARNTGPQSAGYPIVTKNGGQVNELGARRIESAHAEMNQARDEILATYGVPPAKAGVIESGNLGGGTDEGQDKTFDVQTCDPLAALVLEALFYRLAVRGFGVKGWKLQFSEVDTRDSKKIEEIRELRFKNGAYTLNEWRAEIGKPPVEGGDQALVLVAQGAVMRVRDIDASTLASLAKEVNGSGWDIEDRTDPDDPIVLVRREEEPAPADDGTGWADDGDDAWDEDDLADEERDDLDPEELAELLGITESGAVVEAKVRTAAGAKKYGKPIGSTITRADRAAAKARRRKARTDRKARKAKDRALRRRQPAPIKKAALTDADRARVTAAAAKFKPQRFASFDDTNDWLDAHPQKYTDAQAEAIEHYTGNGYGYINEMLRKGEKEPEVAVLDSAMKPAPTDLTVVRQVGFGGWADPFARDAGAQIKALQGKVISDRAYASTTLGSLALDKGQGSGLDEPIALEIAVPKGTPVINARAVSRYQNEGEIILPRGARLLVTSVKQTERWTGETGWNITAMVVPDEKGGTRAQAQPAARAAA